MLFQIALLTFTIFALLSTFRVILNVDESMEGFKEKGKYLNFVTHPGWSLVACFIFIPWMMGAFARDEVSPNPWIEFQNSYSAHGLLDALMSVVIVTFVLLWLFWMPSHIYLSNKKNISKRRSYVVRAINILIGSILITENNFIYSIFEYLFNLYAMG